MLWSFTHKSTFTIIINSLVTHTYTESICRCNWKNIFRMQLSHTKFSYAYVCTKETSVQENLHKLSIQQSIWFEVNCGGIHKWYVCRIQLAFHHRDFSCMCISIREILLISLSDNFWVFHVLCMLSCLSMIRYPRPTFQW